MRWHFLILANSDAQQVARSTAEMRHHSVRNLLRYPGLRRGEKDIRHLVGKHGRSVIKDGVAHHPGMLHEPCLDLMAAFEGGVVEGRGHVVAGSDAALYRTPPECNVAPRR